MISESEIRKVVEQVLTELNGIAYADGCNSKDCNTDNTEQCEEEICLNDITAVDLKKQVLVPKPHNLEGLLKIKEATPARIGVWRAGPRYKTETLLRFRALPPELMISMTPSRSITFLPSMLLTRSLRN